LYGTVKRFHQRPAISFVDKEVFARHCRYAISELSISCAAKRPEKFQQMLFDWFVKDNARAASKKPARSLDTTVRYRHCAV
jgi:hypothetical protein